MANVQKYLQKRSATKLQLLSLRFINMNSNINWDAWGILTSLACAIHCAVLPLLLTSLPIFGINIIDNMAFEYFMILLAFTIGIMALWNGYKKHHHSFWPIILFSVGICFLLLKQVYKQWHIPFLIVAVLLVVTAHIVNYILFRKAKQCLDEACTQ